MKRLDEFGGDITKFTVARLQPSRLKQICIAKTEPGDENNQDVASLVGKVDIRKLEMYSQNDPDAYSFSGGLNRTTQGLMEFVEMFKAPIKMLHPLLTATQESNYAGTENIGGIPFHGIILAHSNRTEWQTFKYLNKEQRGLHRPYLGHQGAVLPARHRGAQDLRKTGAEQRVVDRALRPVDARPAVAVLRAVAPEAARELEPPFQDAGLPTAKASRTPSKTRARNRPRNTSDAAGVDEGMEGISTRFAFKVLSGTFNFDTQEVKADPVHMMYVLEQSIWREQFPDETEKKYLNLYQGRAGAALCRVHRQRDPEGLIS